MVVVAGHQVGDHLDSAQVAESIAVEQAMARIYLLVERQLEVRCKEMILAEWSVVPSFG